MAMSDWIEDFVKCHSNSETPQRILRWVAISTIAGALRRKVWIQEDGYQWTSNFYVVLVAPPGIAKKSTSIDYGKRLLAQCDGINFGPNVATWQALIEELGEIHDIVEIEGLKEPLETACMTVFSSEFGSLFDGDDRKAVDVLTDLWDGKEGDFRKSTKTSGKDTISNPWINIIGCTTPAWVRKNMPEELIGSGFVCRCVWLYADKRECRIAYPSRQPKIERRSLESLAFQLKDIAQLSGQFNLTDEAYEWGTKWYDKYCDYIDTVAGTIEGDFAQRRQTHLHKVAMVVSASRGNAPLIQQSDLEHADRLLQSVEADAAYIFNLIGQSPQSRNVTDLIECVKRNGWMTKRELFRNHFLRKLSLKDYEATFQSAVASGYVKVAMSNNEVMVGPQK